MSKRVFNFSAGPSMMPLPVLERAAREMCDCGGSGMSAMEMSHRSPAYQKIIDRTESSLRRIMSIPDDYAVLFMQGGASTQFAAVPLNIMRTGKADYAVTGVFSGKAATEAKKFGDVNIAATTKPENFVRIPSQSELSLRPDADYFHICGNNTIFGTRWNYIPDTGSVPLVADLSSEILSRPIDVSRYGIIYAGAQKNMGPAGMAVVIIRRDLITDPPANVPTMLSYKTMLESGSMYNTPPTYTIYMLSLMLDWVEECGGLTAMEERNIRKASVLYDILDNSSFYIPHANKDCRSIMNVTFRTRDAELDKRFIAGAAELGLISLGGHRLAGGMRASIYNAMPEEGIAILADYMKNFEKQNA